MSEKNDVLHILQQVRSGDLTPEGALLRLKTAPFQDLGYAKVDHHRPLRQGTAEVIYGQSKTPEQTAGILEAMGSRGAANVLVTRIGPETAGYLKERFPLRYDPLSRLAIAFPKAVEGRGSVVVATGGTSDMPVAEEAALTAEALGSRVTRLYDVGVAGLHRLLANLEPLMSARAVVAVAGMEGALASVVGGSGGLPRHRRAHQRGLRGLLRRAQRTAVHAERLRQRHQRGEYRQRLRSGISRQPHQSDGGDPGMKTLYLECNMGAAGDMLMAALYELLDEKQKDAFFENHEPPDPPA